MWWWKKVKRREKEKDFKKKGKKGFVLGGMALKAELLRCLHLRP